MRQHVATWTGGELRAALRFATDAFQDEMATLDALNVFPVPDGDTGTNMCLTMAAAMAETDRIDENDPRADEIMNAFAHGALFGARGNSGVILSQVLRGFAQGFADRHIIDGPDLGRALDLAAELAYLAVLKPIEGTMLTVVRAAAEAVRVDGTQADGLRDVLLSAQQGAEVALANTPNQLEHLREAGVVDAGGQGIAVLLAALLAYAEGTQYRVRDSTVLPDLGQLASVQAVHDTFGYCTNFLISGQAIPFATARDALAAMGQSAVIVGDESLLKVHIHTDRPGLVLDLGMTWGDVSQIKIDNMDQQIALQAEGSISSGMASQGDPAIITIGSGSGVRNALSEMGATLVLDGGRAMNPSVDQLLRGIASVPANDVIVLPNNGNILMAAKHAADLSGKNVHVVPTRSIPAALAALGSVRSNVTLEQTIAGMEQAIERTVSIEITRATRTALIEGVDVETGSWIAIVNSRLVACAHLPGELVAKMAVAAIPHEGLSLATVMSGAGVAMDLIQAFAAALRSTWPDLELDLVDGGQPTYAFLIGME